MTDLDHLLFRLINDVWRSPVLDLFMPFVSLIANDGLVWLVLIGLLAILGSATDRWVALAGLIALGTGAACSDLLKELTMQPRPFLSIADTRLLIDPPSSYTFPSGHATSAFATASGAVLARWWLLGRMPFWGWGFLALAITISYSRVYLGVHYPSDVLGGVVLGITIGMISAVLITLLRKHKTFRKLEERTL